MSNRVRKFSVKQGYQMLQFQYLQGHKDHPSTVHDLTLKNIENLRSLKTENFNQKELFRKIVKVFQIKLSRSNLEKSCDFLRMSLTKVEDLESLMDINKFSVIQFLKA